MAAARVMVLGTTSNTGKNWPTTALCRNYSKRGLKVAPFKVQNMSSNGRVVKGMVEGHVSGGKCVLRWPPL